LLACFTRTSLGPCQPSCQVRGASRAKAASDQILITRNEFVMQSLQSERLQ